MINILMVLKTQNLKNDQRVRKELDSLHRAGANPDVYVVRDCDTPKENFKYPIIDTSILGGASTQNKLLQVIGIIQFYKNATKYIMKRNYPLIWICDPIMFLLVSIIKKIKPDTRVIWDHHELPPSWFLKNKILMQLFKKSYKSADIVIHANQSRKEYLEELLNYKKQSSYIINNYPDSQANDEDKLDDLGEEWLAKAGNFIYLQNSLQDNRYGAEVIRAALKAGFKVFHAGKINQNYIKKYSLNHQDLFLSGYLSVTQINRVLKKCNFTVILYKQNSLNQIYCDANRLYQAMSLGTPIIIGNNPTLVESSEEYYNRIVLDNDGSNFYIPSNILNKLSPIRNRLIYNWDQFDVIFQKIIQND